LVISYPGFHVCFHLCGNHDELWVWWAISNAEGSKNVILAQLTSLCHQGEHTYKILSKYLVGFTTCFTCCHLNTEKVILYLQVPYIEDLLYPDIISEHVSKILEPICIGLVQYHTVIQDCNPSTLQIIFLYRMLFQ
jgi:hypothetical protein